MIINQVRNPVVDEIDCLELQRRLLDETRALLAEVRAERQAIFTVFLKHAAHRVHKLFQPRRICIERAEHGLACLLDLVLRLSGFQGRREIAPEPIQACVRHFEYAADVVGTLLDKEPGGRRRIAVFAGFAGALPLQQSERDKGVEKIISSARMRAHAALQFRARLGAVRKPREQLQFYRRSTTSWMPRTQSRFAGCGLEKLCLASEPPRLLNAAAGRHVDAPRAPYHSRLHYLVELQKTARLYGTQVDHMS
jgi:hypothetical protein